MKQIKDIMTKNVITVEENASLKDIIALMKENNIKKIPVLNSGKVKGVVRVEDLLTQQEQAPMPPILAINDLIISLPSNKAFQKKLLKLTAYQAKEIMTEEFLMVDIKEDLRKVITDIVEKKFGYALVKEEGKLIGIITQKDLLNNIF